MHGIQNAPEGKVTQAMSIKLKAITGKLIRMHGFGALSTTPLRQLGLLSQRRKARFVLSVGADQA